MTSLKVLGLGLLSLFLEACAPQEPVRIIITPTPAAVAEAASATPTEALEATAEVFVPQASASPTTTPSPVPATETSVPTATYTPSATFEVGDGSFLGSVFGPTATGALPVLPTAIASPTPLATLDPNVSPVPATPAPLEPTVAGSDATPILASPGLDRSRMGVQLYYNMSYEEVSDYLYRASNVLKMGWVKFQIDWAFWQPNGPEEVSDLFKTFEVTIQAAHNTGMKVMLSVAKAPQWARGANLAEDGPPDNPEALANFLRLLITRIKPENIAAIEVWNEPNLSREWRGALPFSGAGYMQLFAPAHRVVRELAPNTLVITAGLAPTGDSEGSIDDRKFLQQMFDAGLGQYDFTAVGVHPYGWGNAPDARCCDPVPGRGWDDNTRFFFLDNLDETRAIMVANNFSDRQMWVTEFGWASWVDLPGEAPEPWMTYVTLEQQAEYALRAWEIGQGRIDVGAMILWNLNFANTALVQERSEIAAYSLMIPDPLRLRPLYRALETGG